MIVPLFLVASSFTDISLGITKSPTSPPVLETEKSECPEDKICIDREIYFMQVKPLLLKLKYIEENPPNVTIDGFTIVTDAEGRVFTDGTGDNPVKGSATWKDENSGVDYTVEFESKQDVTIHKKPPEPKPKWGFRLRIKAGVLLLTALPNWWGNPPSDVIEAINLGVSGLDLALIAEPFFIYDLNVQAIVGLRALGVGLGYDITKNFGIMGGVATTYVGLFSQPTISPFLGLYFAF